MGGPIRQDEGPIKLVDGPEGQVDGPLEHVGIHVGQLGTYVDRMGSPVGHVSSSMEQVGVLVKQHTSGCHLVLISTTNHSSVFSTIVKQLMEEGEGLVVVDVCQGNFKESRWLDLLHGIWGDARLTCRALVILLNDTVTSLTFSFLEWCGISRRPEVSVIMVGGRERAKDVLLHYTLRNTLNILCIALHEREYNQEPVLGSRLTKEDHLSDREEKQVWVYGRCLYCNEGEARVQLLYQGTLSSVFQSSINFFPKQMDNMFGHTFHVVTLLYIPFINYEQVEQQPGSSLAPRDSLNIRLLETFATKLNFTYKLREPWDRNWGTPASGGNWTGIVGTLQHQQADFSLDLTITAPRSQVIDYSRFYNYDTIVIVSLKPTLLPRSLALIRPFEGQLWIVVIICASVVGIIMWLIQEAWAWVSSRRGFNLVSACFASLEILLSAPLTDVPINTSGRVLVGLWLLASFIINSAYRSSLVANLFIQSKRPPVNTFHDILRQNGWSWGSPELQGTFFLFFNQSTDPEIQKILKNMQIYDIKEGGQRLMAGAFSYLLLKTQFSVELARLYTDQLGNTPFYVGTTEYPILGGNAWGFRQGAPFINQISRMKQRLIEAGVLKVWLDQVITADRRLSRSQRDGNDAQLYTEVSVSQQVLGLDHLQGAFYLLLLGYCLALLNLLAEVFTYPSHHFPHHEANLG
ncbi:probable glutamate receptor [Cherax quadricarinatus]|uniref:probable glutamate receptor n=1 Tax=Cherax quadricarinatus TaxID=27406 RepID=UPI00387E6EA4